MFFPKLFISALVQLQMSRTNGVYRCGKSVTPEELRNNSGIASMRFSWPWHANIDGNQENCGGVLITPKYVLTAAHCVAETQGTHFVQVKSDSITVRLGLYNKTNLNDPGVQTRKVKRIRIHESFAPEEKRIANVGDIAILTLNNPAVLNKHVGLSCIGSEPVPKKTICYATGFGQADGNGRVPSILKQIYSPYIEWDTCQPLVRKFFPGNSLNESMCCAGDLNRGQDVCPGDSGGPLVCWSNGRWELQGLVSWGSLVNCGKTTETPGVYANIPFFYDWIREEIDYDGDDPQRLQKTTVEPYTFQQPSCPKAPLSAKPLANGYCQPGINGVQKIRLLNGSFINVLCDGETDEGGWLLVHKREATLRIFQFLIPYQWELFGDFGGDEFWVGTEVLRQLTSEVPMELLFVAHWCDGTVSRHKYKNFQLIDAQVLIDPSTDDAADEGLGSLNCQPYGMSAVINTVNDKSTVDLLLPMGCDIPQMFSAYWYTKEPQRRKTFHSFELKIRPMNNSARHELPTRSERSLEPKPERKKRQTIIYKDCHYLYTMNSIHRSGVQNISIDNKSIKVFCDMETDGGGWTVIQRRKSGNENFQRNWSDYAKGFGDVRKDFWLGNTIIHKLTSWGELMVLRILLEFCDGTNLTLTHHGFSIRNESQRFKLRSIDNRFSFGSLNPSRDGFNYNHNREFMTLNFNDTGADNCVKQLGGGGWWYTNCATWLNLNGKFGCNVMLPKGNFFLRKTIKTTKMMIRPSESELGKDLKQYIPVEPTISHSRYRQPKEECHDYYKEGDLQSGIKDLHHFNVFTTVFCDMSDPKDIGGWTVIMRRIDGREPFNRDWYSYIEGFGSIDKDFWLGNSKLRGLLENVFIPKSGSWELKLDLTFCSGEKTSRLYRNFKVELEEVRYRVHLVSGDQYNDGLSSVNGNKFYAANLNESFPNCGNRCGHGGWWWSEYPDCTKANLSGKFGCKVPYPANMYWIKDDGKREVIKSVVMKIRHAE